MKKLLITNLFLGPSLDSPARQQGRGQLTPVRRPKPVFKMSPVLAGSGMMRTTTHDEHIEMVKNIKMATGVLANLNNVAGALFDKVSAQVLLSDTLRSR